MGNFKACDSGEDDKSPSCLGGRRFSVKYFGFFLAVNIS